MKYASNSFTFFMSAYYIQFSLIPIVFHQFFTWIALGDVDLHFSLNGNADKRKLNEPCDYITSVINPYMNDGVALKSLPASLLLKINVVTDHWCQTALNRKLSCKLER